MYIIKMAECITGNKFYAEDASNAGEWKYMRKAEADALGGVGTTIGQEAYDGLSGVPDYVVPEGSDTDTSDHSHDHARADDDGMGAATGSVSADFLTAADAQVVEEAHTEGDLHGKDAREIDPQAVFDAITEQVRNVVFSDGWPQNGKQIIVFTTSPNEDKETEHLHTQGLMDPDKAVQVAKEYYTQRVGIPYELAQLAEMLEAAEQQQGDDAFDLSPFRTIN